MWPVDFIPEAEEELFAQAFMDDFSVPVIQSAATLLDHVRTVEKVVTSEVAEMGLRINFDRGKTEALVCVAGLGREHSA